MDTLIRTMVMCLVVCGLGLSGAVSPTEAADKPKAGSVPAAVEPKGPHAIIKTKFGEIEVRLLADVAPKHVESFIKLAKSGFYNGTIFHRVIPGFMIQGGDPTTKDPNKKQLYGTGGPGFTVPAEFNDTQHKRGILSMARSSDPNSAGSQFFIVVEDTLHLDHQYTAFGQVVRGIGVADKIVNAPRDPRDNPLERIEMTVEIKE
jgi:peptidyl-prolyl cis-trans isomerase B (cyclophilin B)